MSKGRLIFRNWIVEIGCDPRERKLLCQSESESIPNEKIIKIVRQALSKLYPDEQEFVRRYYFEGESYRQIADALHIRFHKMEGMNCRIRQKLKKQLAPFVRDEFDIEVDTGPECPICVSPSRAEIDQLIESKTIKETWRPIIQKLKKEYGITVKTPQILIGHQKYHKQLKEGNL